MQMITPQNAVRHELIGLRAKVMRAKNPANAKIVGTIVNETYKTLVIKTKQRAKIIFKDQVTLQLELPDKKKVEVDGNLLVARPWDRIKKKLPKW